LKTNGIFCRPARQAPHVTGCPIRVKTHRICINLKKTFGNSGVAMYMAVATPLSQLHDTGAVTLHWILTFSIPCLPTFYTPRQL